MKAAWTLALLATFATSSASADVPQKPPSKDEGDTLPDAIVKRFNLPSGCRVAPPDANGRSARVARVQARMSAWVADQKPEAKDPPKIYLHREGDKHVFLVGPAINPVNMGVLDKVEIKQREGSELPIGIIDHTDEVHWVALTNIGNVRAKVKEYKNGLGDAGMLERMAFTIKNARPTKYLLQKAKKNESSYTVTALIINFLGQPRVFGLCM